MLASVQESCESLPLVGSGVGGGGSRLGTFWRLGRSHHLLVSYTRSFKTSSKARIEQFWPRIAKKLALFTSHPSSNHAVRVSRVIPAASTNVSAQIQFELIQLLSEANENAVDDLLTSLSMEMSTRPVAKVEQHASEYMDSNAFSLPAQRIGLI
eukprot:2246258-Amphidinium_carterae.1